MIADRISPSFLVVMLALLVVALIVAILVPGKPVDPTPDVAREAPATYRSTVYPTSWSTLEAFPPHPTPTPWVRPTPAPTHPPRAVTPTPRPIRGTHGRFLIEGFATYYDAQGAAAGAWLARAMGGGRKYLGQTVRVWYGKRHVDVRLSTSCACGDRHGKHTVIDLPRWAFRQLVAPTPENVRGVISVRIERVPR